MEHEEKHSPQNEAEVIVINDDISEISESNNICKNKRHVYKGQHHKRKRKVKVETANNKETLIVTQKVELRKKKFKCVINLTNVCEHNQKKSRVLKTSLKYANRDRIVPQCLRNTCCTPRRNEKITRQFNTKLRHSKERSRNKERSIQKSKEKRKSNYLSPVSSLELRKSDITYENISSESFSFYSDEELDTLIKRTRDRERKLSQTFESVPPSTALPTPLCSSTPQYIESVSDVDNCTIRSGEMDISIQSLATLVLEPQLDIYSPTQPTGSSENDPEYTLTLEDTIDYSPVKHTVSQMNQNVHDPITENIMYLPSKPLGTIKLETSCEMKEESVNSMPVTMANLEAKYCNQVKTEYCERPETENGILCSINGKSDITNNENEFLGNSPKQLKLENESINPQLIKSENTPVEFQNSNILNCLGDRPISIKIENDFNDNILCQEVEFSQKYSIKPEQ
ncbi:uncharacterized protein LOC126375208 [Pectinophora gossypiella]|uniref:uncharacterized protein LOC126375208 n=1 Tax=Pectinophora gossypiella TaxID=13191 RepID=UPI00214F1372|nr:uncharacterized protein LOC126375208 [Pectinophora gossypiella]XP_049878061.1 uncharacterized protein LOC126375208 [Pectinophora gossypiella]